MLTKITNIFLTLLLPISIILINNTSVVNYSDLFFAFLVYGLFCILVSLPFFFKLIRNLNYDVLVFIFILLVISISLLSVNLFSISFTYKQTIAIWILILFISFLVINLNILKNSFFIFIFLIIFNSSSIATYIFKNIFINSQNNTLLQKNDLFDENKKEFIFKDDENFFFIIFDGFPRINNLKKIGYNTDKLNNIFQKYDLLLLDNTNSSYLNTQKSISSTMNLSLINNNAELNKKEYYKFIQESKLVNIFKFNNYLINWFPNDLTLSDCPKNNSVNCYPAKYKINIFEREIVKFYFNLLLIQPYWIERLNILFNNKIIKNEKILFNLDRITNFVKNNKYKKKQFVFAHILSPHPPYVLNEKCNLQKFGLDYKMHDEENFLKQIDCIAIQLDNFLSEINKNMPNSNLFIHSDHGTTLINRNKLYDEENFENLVLLSKNLTCNLENLKEKINYQILKNIMNCL